jgi:hypothetical protein
MLAGGGTTCGVRVPAPDLASDPPPDALGGGGTGLVCMSPFAVAPQLLRSRLTCEGGGATTAGVGNVSLGLELAEASRSGAETGGGTTSIVCVTWARELAKSRGVSRGAGAITLCSIVGASGLALRILSCETFGAGGTTVAFSVGVDDVRVVVRETSGAGGTTSFVNCSDLRLVFEFNSGEGGTGFTVIAGSAGAMSVERRPSAGGGPGFDLNASRFATAESERGRFTLGASTTFSVGLSPRATRIVCVR